MLDPEARDQWALFVENRDAVVGALRRGECDGILPAACTFFDGFAAFLLEHGIIEVLGTLADHRERRSIPAFFFASTLLHMPLFRLQHLADVENVLFRSPFILRNLGFNARQIADGFYATSGPRPFSAEALADFCAELPAEDLLNHQLAVVRQLRVEFPEVFRQGTYAMDCFLVTCPPGRKAMPAVRLKFCVLSLRLGGRALPLISSCGPDKGEDSGDITRGRELVAALRNVLGREDLALLLIDRGFIDGAWLAEQAKLGTEIIIGVKSDMSAYRDMLGLAKMEDSEWQEVPSPKNHRTPPPKREVAVFPEITSWDACAVPLTGLVVRDRYSDSKEEWQAYVSVKQYSDGRVFYSRQRERWEEEEAFMALTRYWGVDDLPPMREGVARAIVHFTLLAYFMLGLFRWQNERTTTTTLPRLAFPEVDLAVYAGKYYTLLTASDLLTIILDNVTAWQTNRPTLLATLRLAERKADTS